MGLFHCPMGAAFYEDEGCIDCGMCYAKTKEEMVAASKRIRAYLQSHAVKSSAIKKIAVCGKGGVGKSTIVTLVANAFREAGFSVLVFDTDESNPGLYRMFGFVEQPRALRTIMNPVPSGEQKTDAEWLKCEEVAVKDIPQEYILDRDGLKFMMVGKIEDPFQGCACPMAGITRELMARLAVGDKEVVVVDIEAGIESFGRGVERNVDTVLIIVEPSFESIALAERIVYMAQGMGIGRVGAVLNKVPSEETGRRMIEELDKKGVKVIGTVYFDTRLSDAAFHGTVPCDSKAAEDTAEIVKILLSDGAARFG